MKYLFRAVLSGVFVFLLIPPFFASGPQVYIVATFTPEAPKEPTCILFVGDVMLGRRVETLMRENGSSYPFQSVTDFFKENNEVIANLEGPVMHNHVPTPDMSTTFSFNEEYMPVLSEQGVTIVSLGNNHTYDFGKEKYEKTKEILKESKIEFVGHPFAIGEEYALRKTIGDQDFIFVSFNVTNPNFPYQAAVRHVGELASTSPEARVVVLPHWGEEYVLHSNKKQQDFAHTLIDAGAFGVFGHHPHVVEEIELYNGHLIFYSLGNFIFDQYFSEDVEQGLAVQMEMIDDIVGYNLLPIQITQSQPGFMEDNEKTAFLETLAKRSSIELRDSIQVGYIAIE